MDWFLYDRDFLHEIVKIITTIIYIITVSLIFVNQTDVNDI